MPWDAERRLAESRWASFGASGFKSACPEGLAELFEGFDLTAVYDKPNRTLQLAAMVTPELIA